jgi:hypothetical protein
MTWLKKRFFLKNSNVKKGYIFFSLITGIEVIILIFLLSLIFQKNKASILGQNMAIAPIKSANYDFSERGDLKYFYEPKPNSQRTDSVTWLSYTTTYHLNNDGSNSSINYSIEKPADTFRILTIGDSHTFGLYVNPSNNYPSQLELKLNNQKCSNISNFEVINLGVPGYDLDYTIERFKSKGLKYSPDLVIWLIKPDDVFQINELMRGRADQIRAEMKSSGELQKYEQKGEFFPHVSRAQQELEKELGKEAMTEIGRKKLDYLRAIFSGTLVFLSYPEASDLDKLFSEHLKRHPLTFFYNDLPAISKQEYKLPDRHPNELGYKYIADRLVDFMLTTNIIPCDKSDEDMLK